MTNSSSNTTSSNATNAAINDSTPIIDDSNMTDPSTPVANSSSPTDNSTLLLHTHNSPSNVTYKNVTVTTPELVKTESGLISTNISKMIPADSNLHANYTWYNYVELKGGSSAFFGPFFMDVGCSGPISDSPDLKN